MRPLLLTLVVAAAMAQPPAGRVSRREIDSVAAFARLYGVVRYFYPGDAAAGLDWDRFAVYGVGQVRAATNARTLQTTLQSLFVPLGPGIEIAQRLPSASAPGKPDSALIAWRYLGPGIGGAMIGPYKGKRTHRPLTAARSIDGFVSLMQTIPAVDLRGKTIRLRGKVRAAASDISGAAALWLRVDRPGQQPRFFDNRGAVRESDWREYQVEASVAGDATNVGFGMLASGGVTADFDALELAVRDANGAWRPLPIADAGFEEGPGSRAWSHTGTSKTAETSRPGDQAPEGRQYLRFAPAPAAVLHVDPFDSPPVSGAHADVDLGSGLKARVALALTEEDARVDARSTGKLDALRKAVAMISSTTGAPPLDVRLADTTIAWNVFRHFYPYWPEVGVAWDARLPSQLEAAYAANTRERHRDALRGLVAEAQDGHGNVIDTQASGDRVVLPLQLGLVDGAVVITASRSADAPVGAVVSAIDGEPAAGRLAAAMRLVSGSPQWKKVRALQEIAVCATDQPVELALDTGNGAKSVRLRCEAGQRPPETRPEPVSELATGIWYVDLTRAPAAQLTPKLEQLAGAAGVVFDVRGYPTDAGARILPYLVDTAESDRWMHVARIVGPFGELAGWQSAGWNVMPGRPRLMGKIVFLTDARAISYAESVMGYVADRKLGTIVGGPTAGTNGNVVAFTVPGGFRIPFTGMRVTRHDGEGRHHLVGVQPNIPVTQTLAALRAGRDEVLERAVALIRGR